MNGYLRAAMLFACTMISLGAGAAEKKWIGGAAEGPTLASVAANWSPTGIPDSTSDIVLDGDANNNRLVWDIDVEVASWSQTAAYGGTVTLMTGETGVTAKGSAVTVHGALAEDGAVRELKINGALTLSGGTWSGTNNPSFNSTDTAWKNGRGAYRVIVEVGGDASIAADATVSVVGNGYYYVQGPGVGSGGAGGSHGGRGSGYNELGGQTGHLPAHCFGSIRNPVTLGCTGSDRETLRSLPGGAIRLKVSGALTLNGTLDASGSTLNKTGGTATRAVGSGGSVWVTAKTLTGAGAIKADGVPASNFGSSGGGRISVQLSEAGANFASFTGGIAAYGGYINAGNMGTPGSIYLETPANKAAGGDLIYKGRNTTIHSTAAISAEIWSTMAETNTTFASVTLTNGAALVVGPKCVLRTPVLKGYRSATEFVRLRNGSLDITSTAPIENLSLVHLVAPSMIACQTLRLGTGAVFNADRPMTITNVVLSGTGKITHTANSASDDGYRVDLDVPGDFTIGENASVNVEGRGYSAANGPGKPGIGNCASSHGGLASNTNSTGVCYGDPKHPTTLASGSSHTAGSGAIRLNVGGMLSVTGSITAKGMNQTGLPSAGGSVWLSAGALSGTGVIRANGGQPDGYNWPETSGGGRLAVTVTNTNAKVSDFAGTITACGGISPDRSWTKPYGGAGTVYLRDWNQDDDHGTLIIDNAGSTFTNGLTVFGAAVSNCVVGSVVITNCARLFLENDRRLTVNGNWTSVGGTPSTLGAAAVGASAAGEILFAGSGASEIRGTNHFMNFACATPGKTLSFGTGDTLMRVDGDFTIAGAKENRITLCSLQEGTPWYLQIVGGADVQGAAVGDSDASVGKAITAFSSVGLNANNKNWSFASDVTPGETIVWTAMGGVGDWTDINNWSRARVPVGTDVIEIPADCGHYPTLAVAFTANSISIAAGAALGLGGFDLAVTNALVCAGTLAAHGTEMIALGGDASFAGAVLATPPALLLLSGETAQTVDLGGLSFTTVTLANAGPGATLAGGFTAKKLLCTTTAARTYAFEADRTVVVTEDLILNGVSGDAALLTLASTTPGSAWRLDMRRFARVSGVVVSDSDASAGKCIFPEMPSSGTASPNWVFGMPTATWTGAADTWFTNANNWSSAAVPDETTHVVFDSAATVKLGDGEGVTVRAVTAADGTAAKFTGKATLTVLDTVDVQDGATVTLDAPVVVSNAVTVRAGGTITHSANGNWDGTTDPNDRDAFQRIVLTVAGDLDVEANGAINASGKGFPAGTGTPSGPGHPSNATGAGHGGRMYSQATYGTPFEPLTLGSGGQTAGHHGGGAARLAVGGTLTVNGVVSAKGNGCTESGNQSYAGSGGSIWITCGELAGAGTLTVKGGDVFNNFCGSGGRIAVHQTTAADFAAWQGAVVVEGGRKTGDAEVPRSAPGTAFLRSAGGNGGRLLIDGGGLTRDPNHLNPNSYTDILPTNWCPAVKADFRNVTVEISGKAQAYLLDNLKIEDFELAAGSSLDLAGHELRLGSRTHCNAQTRAGVYSPTWPGTVNANGGRIVWSGGLVVIIR